MSGKLKEVYLLFYNPMSLINSFITVIIDSNLKPGLTYTQSDEDLYMTI